MTNESGIGAAVRRKEDIRFLTGQGRYVDDINRPDQAYAYFVRSPHAHAEIRDIATSAAQQAPGVLAVYTAEDQAADALGGLICGWVITQKNGEPHNQPPHSVLATGKVRYVGEPVAVVIAETLDQAKDAADQVSVDYAELPAVVAIGKALEDGAPQLHDEAPGNLCFEWEIGDKAAADAAFEAAHKVVSLELINNRLVPNAMEPRAAVGEYDAAGDNLTLFTTSQNPHVARLVLSAFIGIAQENKLRVVAPDVGGGFGAKIYVYSEETTCLWAARKLRRPVKWTADRSEAFVADTHARDHETVAELALDADGKFLGLRASTKANLGAYTQIFSTATPTYLYGCLLTGQYKTPAVYCEVTAGFTNTCPVDAYRGAGRPEATYVVERLVDIAARETGLDPVEIRRRNFIDSDQFPYETPVIMTYDSGDFDELMNRALTIIDYDGFQARKAESATNGKLRGIGISCFIESCGLAPSAAVGALGGGVGQWESAQIRFDPTGSVTLYTGSHSHGQGHETSFAQVVSSLLGVPVEKVEVNHGDTAITPFGMGTYGSRSMPVGGAAIVTAANKVIEKGKKIAAHLMEAAVDDISFDAGTFSVAGTDKSVSIGEVAFAAYVPHNYPEGLEPGLDENGFYDPVNFTFPSGTHIAELEIDPDTGHIELLDWVAVDDFGTVINPLIVEGQVHGGVAQGVGQAMLENCTYDAASGQLVTGSYMDYCMPRAGDLPSLKLDFTDIPCPHNPLGVKGCGEAGAIASPAAFMNAVADALGKDIDMPATAEKIWRAARNA